MLVVAIFIFSRSVRRARWIGYIYLSYFLRDMRFIYWVAARFWLSVREMVVMRGERVPYSLYMERVCFEVFDDLHVQFFLMFNY